MLKRTWRSVLALCLFGFFCLLVPSLAETLNGLRAAGVPLGFWLMAQGAPVILALAAVLMRSKTGPLQTQSPEGYPL